MKRQTKRFIISLGIVLIIAYSIIISVVGIHSFIKVQNLKNQLFSLNLVRQELKSKIEEISSQLKDYEKEKKMLDESLEELSKETERRHTQISSRIESYKNKIEKLSQDLDKKTQKLLALKKENKLLKEEPKKKEASEQFKQALAQKEEQLDKLKQKVENLRQELKDKKVMLHYNLAVDFSQRKDFRNAIIEYEKALSIDPRHSPSHYNLGILYEEYEEDYSRAISHYRRYVQLRPNSPEASQVKQWILELEDKL